MNSFNWLAYAIATTNSNRLGTAVLVASCLLANHVAALCDNNAIKYSGQYIATYSGRSNVDAESRAIAPADQEAQFVITTPPGEQAPSERYWLKRYTDKGTDFDDTSLGGAAASAQKYEVDSLCVAAPYNNAGLQCADVDDAGISALHPLEVDSECNLVKAWSTYLEPATPGCDGPMCYPVASIRTFVRDGSEAGTNTISVSDGAISRGGLMLSLMLSTAIGLVAMAV